MCRVRVFRTRRARAHPPDNLPETTRPTSLSREVRPRHSRVKRNVITCRQPPAERFAAAVTERSGRAACGVLHALPATGQSRAGGPTLGLASIGLNSAEHGALARRVCEELQHLHTIKDAAQHLHRRVARFHPPAGREQKSVLSLLRTRARRKRSGGHARARGVSSSTPQSPCPPHRTRRCLSPGRAAPMRGVARRPATPNLAPPPTAGAHGAFLKKVFLRVRTTAAPGRSRGSASTKMPTTKAGGAFLSGRRSESSASFLSVSEWSIPGAEYLSP